MTHPATTAANIITRLAETHHSRNDGLFRDEYDALLAVVPMLKWIGQNADVLRDIAQRVTTANRERRLLTDAEIADIATDPTVAALIITFPGAVIHSVLRPAITPPDTPDEDAPC